jgi:hypothetical protein
MIKRPDPAPPRFLSGWQLVVLVGLVAVSLEGGLLLIAPNDRLDLLRDIGGLLAPYAGTVLAAGAAVVAAYAARATKHETARQTPLIEQTARNTNGALTERDRRIAELEARLQEVTAQHQDTAPAGT